MPPKKSGRKPRGRTGIRQRGGNWLRSLESVTFRASVKVLFLFIFGAFIFIGLTSGLVSVSALAGIAVFLWGAIIFPVDRFQDAGRWLWSGRAGEDAHNLWCRLIPWRGGGR